VLETFTYSVYTFHNRTQKQAMMLCQQSILNEMAQRGMVAVGGWRVFVEMDMEKGQEYVQVSARGEVIE